MFFLIRHCLFDQGVSYSQKFHGRRSFTNLASSRTSQFMFPKYLIEYQNVKIVKSTSEKSKKNKHKNNAVSKENKKDIIMNMCVTWPLNICYSFYAYALVNIRQKLCKNTILTGKNVLLNSVQEWLLGCFWPFWYVYTINWILYILLSRI